MGASPIVYPPGERPQVDVTLRYDVDLPPIPEGFVPLPEIPAGWVLAQPNVPAPPPQQQQFGDEIFGQPEKQWIPPDASIGPAPPRYLENINAMGLPIGRMALGTPGDRTILGRAVYGEEATPQAPDYGRGWELPNVKLEQAIPEQATSAMASFGRGALQSASEFTTPSNIDWLLGGATKIAGPVLSRIAAGGFGIMQLAQLYQQDQQFKQAVDAGDINTAYNIAGQMLTTGAMSAMMGKHALTKPKSAMEGTYDSQNIQGLPSEVGVGQKPLEAQPFQGPGREAAGPGGALQKTEKVDDILSDIERQPLSNWERDHLGFTPEAVEFSKNFERTSGYGSSNRLISPERYQRALQSWKNRTSGGTFSDFTGVAPGAVELFEIGLFKLEAGARTKAVWAKQMVKELGEEVRPYLDDTFNQIQNLVSKSRLSEEEISEARGILKGIDYKAGRYVGTPEKIQTPRDLAQLTKFLEYATKKGENARFWYERSSEAILRMFAGDKEAAAKFVELLAIYSPKSPVKNNAANALRAYYQWLGGQPIAGGGMKRMDKEATRALVENILKEGPKRNNFYLNLLAMINPEKLDPSVLEKAGVTAPGEAVTIDVWMQRVFGFSNDAPTEQQYKFAADMVRRIAKKMDWTPAQVQAALWTYAKASDVTTKERAKGKKTRVGQFLAKSGYDFHDAIEDMRAELATESAPGKTTGHLPGYHKASVQEQRQYHNERSQIFLDEDGNDIILKELGVGQGKSYEAVGVFEGEINPVTKIPLFVPEAQKTRGGKKTGLAGTVDPSVKALIDGASALRGLINHQDGAGWVRPFYDAKKGDSNGAYFRIGRALTDAESRALEQALPDVAIINKFDGVQLLKLEPNRKTKYKGWRIQNKKGEWVNDNISFQRFVEKVLESQFSDGKLGSFKAHGDYATYADYKNRIAAAGRPDVFRRLELLLQERAAEIDQRYAHWREGGGVGLVPQPGTPDVPQKAQPAEAPAEVDTPQNTPRDTPRTLTRGARKLNQPKSKLLRNTPRRGE